MKPKIKITDQMEAEERRALLESIFSKWEKILHGGSDNGHRDCPLCRLHKNPKYKWIWDCPKCIYRCSAGSAYSQWAIHVTYGHDEELYLHKNCEECCDLATAVQESLIDCLPEQDQADLDKLWKEYQRKLNRGTLEAAK